MKDWHELGLRSQAQTFHPETWPRTRDLDHAETNVTGIEVDATFYHAQTSATLATRANPVPDGFAFALKAGRYATIRKIVGAARESVIESVA